jgi:DNA-binding response OmpR family regulator
MEGTEVCKLLREKWKNIPILMLTSRSSKSDMIWWLELWADDYMVKPFDYDELLARIYSLTRRNLKNKSTTQISIHTYIIDLEKKIVRWSDWEIKLSHLEFDLFLYFAQNKWKVLSRQEIYEKVWGEYDEFNMGKTVDVYIWYLRKKFWKDMIETKKWFWYIIQ